MIHGSARVLASVSLAALVLVLSRNHPHVMPIVSAQSAPDDGAVVVFAKDQMIPMRDGVKLATDIYRPARAGVPLDERLPILLNRTPYSKDAAGVSNQARWFARHGYVVVVQDERGAYKSEGVQSKYMGYGQDGYDTIEYVATLPYTDGQVGMWGTSYSAHAEAGAAILKPPHLKTIVLNCGGLYDGWTYKMRNHGAFELAQQLTWAFTQLAAQSPAAASKAGGSSARVADWVGAMQAGRGNTPLATAPAFDEFFFDMMTKADESEYWTHPDRNWSRNFDRTADIPMIHLTGWYDSYTSGSIANYVALSQMKRSRMRLLVGPWLHGANTRSSAGDVEFGDIAAIPDFGDVFHLRWFDHVLKHKDTGADRDPAVTVFVMGTGDGHRDANGRLFHGGYWKTATTWPLPGTRMVPYYFHGDGTLSTTKPGVTEATISYTYDPRDPVPTIGGSFTGSRDLSLAGAFDQRERPFNPPAGGRGERDSADPGVFGSKPPFLPLAARPDVVVFQTPPLDDDLEVVGPITVTVFASSTAPDTDFTAKLIDVYPASRDYPDGYAMNLTDGIVRARYRASASKPEMMRPGEVYSFRIEPFPTGNVFKKGHRIRVDISSSNFPRFDVNPNTGEPLGRSRRIAVADNSLHLDATHPSSIVLPVVGRPTPRDGLAAPPRE